MSDDGKTGEASGAETDSRGQLSWSWAIGLSILAAVVFVVLTGIPGHPFSRRARYGSPVACTSNLRMFDAAKATWAMENKKSNSDVPTDADLFGQNSYVREKPPCPVGGTYTLGSVGTKPRCSIPGHTL